MQSDDLTRDQHDISEFDQNPIDEAQTPEDQDEEQIAGGEINTDIDDLHKKAFGDSENLPLGKAVNRKEIKRVKNLTNKQQKPSENHK